ncbi:MAG: hypothetical protein M8364_03075 [Methylobacter sp.]|uniref:hypothetical protein n=1 Tax=Methylobacter sp. TaxID=2051955 RepID=UPI002583346C|nr:hypothetical protein [Methylobacter sp.]MCL7419870.1 hypothetical protein [Methylobacter sp.]
MNALIKKIFAVGSMLLLSACAHYSRSYYPDSVSYGGGYTVIERDYYRSAPDYGYYTPGGNHYYDAYRPRWQAGSSHDHYHPTHQHESHSYSARRPQGDSHHWAQPRRQHEDHRPQQKDRRMPDHRSQPGFRDGNRQNNRFRPDYTGPVAGRPDQRQFGGARDDHRWQQHENRGSRREERGTPDRSPQQRGWERSGNRGDERRMTAPGQERRQRPERGNPRQQGR